VRGDRTARAYEVRSPTGRSEVGATARPGEDGGMGPTARSLQALGILLFCVTAFLPVHQYQKHPLHLQVADLDAQTRITLRPVGQEAVPARELYDALMLDLGGTAPGCRSWEVRRWYPYALAPFWLWALAWVAGPAAGSTARRGRVGAALLTLAVIVAVLEACYLGVEYAALFPSVLGRAEALIVWVLVVGVLFLRRRADRRIAAVEAHVGAQALLSLFHLLTLPSSEARPWVGPYAWSDVCGALATNFRPAFWLACAGVALAAGATYLSPRRPPVVPDPPQPAPLPEPAGARG
jgi:hypothetical protein